MCGTVAMADTVAGVAAKQGAFLAWPKIFLHHSSSRTLPTPYKSNLFQLGGIAILDRRLESHGAFNTVVGSLTALLIAIAVFAVPETSPFIIMGTLPNTIFYP